MLEEQRSKTIITTHNGSFANNSSNELSTYEYRADRWCLRCDMQATAIHTRSGLRKVKLSNINTYSVLCFDGLLSLFAPPLSELPELKTALQAEFYVCGGVIASSLHPIMFPGYVSPAHCLKAVATPPLYSPLSTKKKNTKKPERLFHS